MFNLSVLLEASATRYGEKPAFSLGTETLSFARLNADACRVATGLKQHGIGRGDRVALYCPNILVFPILYYGILKVGAAVVPLNILFKTDELVYHLTDSQSSALFCFSGTHDLPMGQYGWAAYARVETCRYFFGIPSNEINQLSADAPLLEDLIDGCSDIFETALTDPNDTAAILYTSGTTGRPKGAELSHSNLFCNTILSADLLRLSQTDTQLLTLPLFHILAMTVQMNAGIYRGVHSVLLPRFDVNTALHLFEKHQITVFVGVPTMYWLFCQETTQELPAHTLRICVSGGASLPVTILKAFESRFNVIILEGYGMSEGSPVTTFNQLEIGRKPGSVGTPVWGVEVKVIDENGNSCPPHQKGELLYRGHNVMKGYFNQPETTADVLINGWMHSGDVAVQDEDGFFYIVDRLKDMIIRGGENIYPSEVEAILMQHPAISLAAVIGVPSEKLGEEVKAYVVLKTEVKIFSDEIIAWAKTHMAAYKYPRIVEIRTSLAVSPSGKLLKNVLRAESTPIS